MTRPTLTHAEILSIRPGDIIKHDGEWRTITKVWYSTCCQGKPIAKITADDSSGYRVTDTVFDGWYRDRIAFTEAGSEVTAAEHLSRLDAEVERVWNGAMSAIDDMRERGVPRLDTFQRILQFGFTRRAAAQFIREYERGIWA